MAGVHVVGAVGIKGQPVLDDFLRDLKRELKEVERKAPPVEVDAKLRGEALKREVKEEARKASGEEVEVDVLARVRKESWADAKKQIQALKRQAREIKDAFAEIQFQGLAGGGDWDIEKQMNGMRRSLEKLSQVDEIDWDIEPVVDAGAMSRVRHTLSRLQREVIEPAVRPIIGEAGIARVKAQLRAISDDVQVQFEAVVPRRQLIATAAMLRTYARTLRPTIHFGVAVSKASMAAAMASVRGMARLMEPVLRRVAKITIPVVLEVSKASLAKVWMTLKALSGYTAYVRVATDTGRMVTEFDRLAKAVSSIGTIGGGVALFGTGAAGTVAVMAKQMSSLLSIGALLPSMFASAGISVGVLVAAFKDAGTVLGDLKPMFSELQQVISGSFWAEAAQPIRDLATTWMPALQAGFERVAGAMGGFTRAFADGLRAAISTEDLEFMFSMLEGFFVNAEGMAGNLASIIGTLGTYGSQYLPQIGQWLTDITGMFDEWLARVASDGTLDKWVSDAIQFLTDLGTTVWGLGTIVTTVGGIAEQAGFRGMGGIAAAVSGAAEVIKREDIQGLLLGISEGARAGLDQVGEGFKELGEGFKWVAPAIGTVLDEVGGIIGEFLGGIGDMISDPQFGGGLEALFEGLGRAAEGLRPVFQELGPLFGALFASVGQFGGALGEAFGVLASLGPVLTDVMAALGPIAEVLVNELADVLAVILPPIYDSIEQALPIVVGLVEQLAPVVGELLKALGPIWQEVMPPLLDAIDALIDGLMPIIQAIMPHLVQLIVSFAQVLGPLFGVIADLIRLISPFWTTWLPVLNTLLDLLSVMLVSLVKPLNGVREGIQNVTKFMQPFLNEFQRILGTGGPFEEWMNGIIDGFMRMAREGMGLIDVFFRIGRDLVQGLVNGISGSIWQVTDVLFNGINNAVRNVKGFLGIRSPSRLFMYLGDMTSEGFVVGFERNTAAIDAAMLDAVTPPAVGRLQMPNAFSLPGVQAGAGAQVHNDIDLHMEREDPGLAIRRLGAELSRAIPVM